MSNSNRQKGLEPEQPWQFKKYLPVLAEAWIFATIVAFLVVRIFGSNVFKHFLRSVGH
jgi:hypothetical protein